MLLQGWRTVLRSRSPTRLLDALDAYLGAHADASPARTLVRASVIGDGTAAVLVPRDILGVAPGADSALRRRRLLVFEGPFAVLHVDDWSVEVPGGFGELPPASVCEHTAAVGRCPPGRYRLAGWIVSAQDGTTDTRSQRTAILMRSVARPGVAGPARVLAALAALTIPVLPMRHDAGRALVDAASELLRRVNQG